MRTILIVGLSLLSPILAAQSSVRDTVVLKTGARIAGSVLEQIDGLAVRLRTTDGRQILFLAHEVQRVISARSERSTVLSGSIHGSATQAASLMFVAGGSLPVAAFGSLREADGGLAQVGGAAGVNLTVPASGGWHYGLGFLFAMNPVNAGEAGRRVADAQTTWADASPWSTSLMTISWGYSTDIGGVRVFAGADAGFLHASSPKITLRRTGEDVVYAAGSDNVFALGAHAGGHVTTKVSVSVRVVSASTAFRSVASGGEVLWTTGRRQSIGLVYLLAGIDL